MKKALLNNKKNIYIAVGILIGAVILGFGIQRGLIYREILGLIKKAETLEKNKEYQEAIGLLRNAQARVFTSGLKAKISQSLEEYKKEIGKHKESIAKEKMGIISFDGKEYKKDEVVVKYKKDRLNLKTSSGKLNAEHLAESKSTKIEKNISLINGALLKIEDGKTVEEKIAELEKDPNVEYAEPNYIYQTSLTPDDSSFGELWGLNNTGQFVRGREGTVDADADLVEAWDITTGSSNVVIAVIDTGVDFNHPDLSSNIWLNTNEVAGNQIDDDGNGYVDDVRGWDFWSYDNDPMDLNSHGTHVSGTIAAVGNNATGITGINWTAKIMPVRFLSSEGYGYLSDAILAINYAVDNGAKILSNSWGSYYYSQSLYDAILAAKNQGVLVVAAAGNSPYDCDYYSWCIYPAGYNLDNIISVAATDQIDNLAWFSTYGPKSVDVGAPGRNIYSTVPPEREAFWTDDVEGVVKWNAQSPWTVSTAASHSPTHSWRCPGQPVINSSLVLTNPLDLSNRRGTQMKFYTYLDLGWGPEDYLYVEASTNGIDWTLIYWPLWISWSEDFEEYVIDLSDYDGQGTVYVRFRQNFEYDIPEMGTYIDDIQFQSYPAIPTENYDYYMGTSMATPHVSGLAGLLLGYNQNLSWSDIKNLILWTGDATSALNGKVFSNRRINAKNALTLPVIVDNYSLDGVWTKSNQTITLSPIHAGGLSQISQVKYCEGASCNPSSGTVISSPYKLSYAGTQNKIVRYQAWNLSNEPSITGQYNLKIDQILPTGSIKINNNATYTRASIVTLNLSASDSPSGVMYMRFSNGSSKWTSWQSYKTTYSWNLTSSTYGGSTAQGTRKAYVQFRDKAG
ncbi:MAG: hypothetical protein COS98_01610, partial [Parcubacteria group bacterium CG07_land_8_20_14_0_80_35_11]